MKQFFISVFLCFALMLPLTGSADTGSSATGSSADTNTSVAAVTPTDALSSTDAVSSANTNRTVTILYTGNIQGNITPVRG